MGFYNRIRGENEESSNPVEPVIATAGRHTRGASEARTVEPETTINLIENQTCVRTYQVTGSLNHDVSNLILSTIHPVIEMQTGIIYSFSCSIYRERNRLSQHHKMLPPEITFMILSQIEEYIRQCELR